MKLLELKSFWILIVASFIMAIVIVGIEGGIANMDVKVYYALLTGSAISLVALSSIPALVVAFVNKILNKRPLIHTFTSSVWVFWAVAIFTRFNLSF